LNSRTVLLE